MYHPLALLLPGAWPLFCCHHTLPMCPAHAGIAKTFCFSCWAGEHRSREMVGHTFSSLQTVAAAALACVQCGAPATRKCLGCDGDAYCLADYQRMHKKGRRAKHEWVGFKTGAMVCVECEEKLATVSCAQCGDSYCVECSAKVHAKGKRKQHLVVKIMNETTAGGGGGEQQQAAAAAAAAAAVAAAAAAAAAAAGDGAGVVKAAAPPA